MGKRAGQPKVWKGQGNDFSCFFVFVDDECLLAFELLLVLVPVDFRFFVAIGFRTRALLSWTAGRMIAGGGRRDVRSDARNGVVVFLGVLAMRVGVNS